MRLLNLLDLITKSESRSLNKKIKKLLDRVETRPCSEKQFNRFLFDIDFYIRTAKDFNAIYFHTLPGCVIPVEKYEARFNLAKQVGRCYISPDDEYA